MLVNSNSLLYNALKDGYAIPAYNINNLEWTKYILEACNEDNSPVIIAVSETTINYCGGCDVVYSFVSNLIKDLNIKIPVVLHLDHGSSIESCKKAIDAGFTSIMIDASSKNVDDNVLITNDVVSYAKLKNVSVEAEIGSLNGEQYTDPDDATDFINQVEINSLAPSVGNKHGFYDEDFQINFELLALIGKEVKMPMVLHGASGLDENKIKTAIFCGVSKININTDIQYAWAKAVRAYLNYSDKEYDPRVIIGSGEKAIKQIIHEKNRLFGSINRAN